VLFLTVYSVMSSMVVEVTAPSTRPTLEAPLSKPLVLARVSAEVWPDSEDEQLATLVDEALERVNESGHSAWHYVAM